MRALLSEWPRRRLCSRETDQSTRRRSRGGQEPRRRTELGRRGDGRDSHVRFDLGSQSVEPREAEKEREAHWVSGWVEWAVRQAGRQAGIQTDRRARLQLLLLTSLLRYPPRSTPQDFREYAEQARRAGLSHGYRNTFAVTAAVEGAGA